MIDMQKMLAQIMASTIPPDKTDLDSGTVASVVITGISVVFIGLIILILLVTLYGKIFEAINARAAAAKEAEEKAAKAKAEKAAEGEAIVKSEPESVTAAGDGIEDGIEEEVVAVIMAPNSAMSAETGKKLVLKSVRTAKPQRPVWASAGVNENTRPF